MARPLLVLVHGRAQSGRSSEELLAEWTGTLKRGLGDARAERLAEVDIRMPFYGDILDELVNAAAPPPGIATRGDPAGLDPGYVAFLEEYLEEVRQQEGLEPQQVDAAIAAGVKDRGPLNWGWVQGIMRSLEAVPGLSAGLIERFTRDVWVYLTDNQVRRRINGIVADTIEPGRPLVVVGHSLGSVVAYDVLRTTAGLDAALYLTVGSPLGIRSVKSRLAPIAFPAGLHGWFNALDERDVVALRSLDSANFPIAPPIENYNQVRNRTDNAHGIKGYLNNPVVAERLFKPLFDQ